MKIIDESPHRLTLIEPEIEHKMFFGILAIGFGIGVVGTAASGDASFITVAIPALISIGGFAGLRYGGKPDVISFDRNRNLLQKVSYPGFSPNRLSSSTFLHVLCLRIPASTN